MTAEPDTDGPTFWQRVERRAFIAFVGAMFAALALGLLIVVDASIGHDGLHCELGLVLHETDDACGGFWK